MTIPHSETARQIAERLSLAMKRAVLWLPADGSWQDHRRIPNVNSGVSETSLYALKDRVVGNPTREVAQIFTLVENDHASGAKEKGQWWSNTRYRLTPLGLEVRQILQESPPQ